MSRHEETTRSICENGDLTPDYAILLAQMVDNRDQELLRQRAVNRQLLEIIKSTTELFNVEKLISLGILESLDLNDLQTQVEIGIELTK